MFSRKFLSASIIIATSVFSLGFYLSARQRIAPPPSLVGVLVNEPDSVVSEKRPLGLYRLQLHDPASGWSQVVTDTRFSGADGVVNCVDRTLMVSRSTFADNDILDLNIFDNLSWKHLQRFSGDAESSMTAAAYNPADRFVYAWFRRLDGTFMFGRLDPTNGARKILHTGVEEVPVAMTSSPSGSLYAFTADGRLCAVSLSDGSLTTLFDSLPCSSASRVSSAFLDNASGAIYWSCAADSVSSLYTVDVTNGSCALVGTYPAREQIAGLMLSRLATPLKAPDTPTDVVLTLKGTSLSGNLSFTAPASLYDASMPEISVDDDALPLTWVVAVDGEEVADGAADFGGSVQTEINFPQAGMHSVSVWFENNEGASPEGVVTRWVGPDLPVAPENIALNYDPVTARYHLSWTPPTAAAHGGEADLSALRYDVVRLPSGITVAEDIAATEFSETVEDPEAFATRAYVVTAKNDAGKSASVRSAYVATSSMPLPAQFRPGEWLDRGLITVSDLNGDGRTWESAPNGEIGVRYATVEMDDWFFLPTVWLEQGKLYPFAFECRGDSRSFTERIEVKMGRAPEPAAMTTTVVARRSVIGSSNTDINTTLRPQESGEWYIGFHGCSEPSSLRLVVNNIMLADSLVIGAPQPITGLKIVNDPDGKPEFDLEFTAPTHTIDGRELNLISEVVVRDDIELLTRFRNVRPGQVCRIHINRFVPGVCALRITPEVGSVSGQTVMRKFSVGAAVPGAVEKVTATLNDGLVNLSWTAPEVDENGYEIVPLLVGYDIYDSFGTLVAAVNNATELQFAAPAGGGANAYTVVPRSAVIAGEEGMNRGGAARSEAIIFDEPLPADYVETLKEGRPLYPWGVTSKGKTAWEIGESSETAETGVVTDTAHDGADGTTADGTTADSTANNGTEADSYCFRLQGSGRVESTLHSGFVSFDTPKGSFSFLAKLAAKGESGDEVEIVREIDEVEKGIAVIEVVMVLRDSTEISLGSVSREVDASQLFSPDIQNSTFNLTFPEGKGAAAFRIRATIFGEGDLEIRNVAMLSEADAIITPAPRELTAVGMDNPTAVLLQWIAPATLESTKLESATSESDAEEFAPESYNIYRDNEFLGSVGAEVKAFIDLFEGDSALYQVCGVWKTEKGETLEGDAAEVWYQRSSVGDRIEAERGVPSVMKIVHRGGELNLAALGFSGPLSVRTLDGRQIYSGHARTIKIPKGIFIAEPLGK